MVNSIEFNSAENPEHPERGFMNAIQECSGAHQLLQAPFLFLSSRPALHLTYWLMGTCLLFQDQICSDLPSWKEEWHKVQISDTQCYTSWDTHLFTVPSPVLTHKVSIAG